MTRSHALSLLGVLILIGAACAPNASAAGTQTQKPGGTLTLSLREDLSQGFAIHETATISTVWPAMPCLNNLLLFDPLKKTESLDTIIGELAEKWSWQDNYRNLVFFLRKGVKWPDGQPFTSRDVRSEGCGRLRRKTTVELRRFVTVAEILVPLPELRFVRWGLP